MLYYKDWSLLTWTTEEWGFDSMWDLAGWEKHGHEQKSQSGPKVLQQQMASLLQAVK